MIRTLALEPDLQHRFEGYLGAIGDVRAASTLDRGGDFMTKWIPASRVRGLESAFMSCSCASTAIDTVLAQDEASDRTEPGCATHPDRLRGGR